MTFVLSRDFPISDEAIEAAARTAAEHYTHIEATRAAIDAFLKAEGFEVERRQSVFNVPVPDGGEVKDGHDFRSRLVSKWRASDDE